MKRLCLSEHGAQMTYGRMYVQFFLTVLNGNFSDCFNSLICDDKHTFQLKGQFPAMRKVYVLSSLRQYKVL